MVGLAITGYQYALATSADSYATYGSYITSSWTSGTSFVITGLTNGTLYKVKIRAVNSLGPGAESVETGIFKPFTVPSAPAAPTVSLGTGATTTDTFTWIAPAANGDAITKYGYQTSTDDGATWSAETEQAGLTKGIETAYTTSSYKLRARAFNAAGWGSYSLKSTGGTGAWALGSTAVSQSCSQGCSQGCSCGACACGSNNGTQTGTQTGTQSRTCYTWTRSGSTTSSIRNANGVDACSSAYGACGSFGACTSCSGCGTFNYVQSPVASGTGNGGVFYGQQLNGGDYRWIGDSSGGWTDAYTVCPTCAGQPDNCSSCGAEYLTLSSYSVYECSSTGEKRWVFGGCYCYSA